MSITVAPAPKKKRAKPFAANARAMADLRSMGFACGVVEKRLPHCFITKDFLGCIDIIAARAGIGVLGIQVTAGRHHADRYAKSLAEPQLRPWLESGARFEVWSYDLRGAAGARKTYALRREEIHVADLPPAAGGKSEEFCERKGMVGNG
jgi:hypothetical protein